MESRKKNEAEEMKEETKAYIFDMDGTLVNNCRYHIIAWQEFSRRYGHELTAREIIDWMGAPNTYYCEQIFGRPLSTDELARLGEEKERIYRELFAPHLRLPDGLRAFLDRAHDKGIQCAVATGGPKENVDFVLDGLAIRKDFKVVIDASCYTHGKPAPDCFLVAASRLGVSAERCTVFEDAVAGIRAAKTAGMRVIAVTFTNPRTTLLAEAPDRIIDSYTEL